MEDNDDKKTAYGRDKKSGLTRRKWLIDIGKAAAVAGVAGKSLPFEAEGIPATVDPKDIPKKLPPGLYSPSFDHLGSAMGNDSRFHAIPPGCEVDFIRPRTGPFEPQFFTQEEYKVIHKFTALMLGEPEDGPQMKGQPTSEDIVDEVAEWIDLHTYCFAGIREAAEHLTPEQIALAEAYNGARLLHRIKTTDPQKTYRAGLAWIAEESKRRLAPAFLGLIEEQQIAILDLISDDHGGENAENDGTRFFRQFKGDVISCFYTSRTGLKELDDKANRFYGESPGCPSS